MKFTRIFEVIWTLTLLCLLFSWTSTVTCEKGCLQYGVGSTVNKSGNRRTEINNPIPALTHCIESTPISRLTRTGKSENDGYDSDDENIPDSRSEITNVTEQRDVLSMLQALSQELTNVRVELRILKMNSKREYRQLKNVQIIRCAAASVGKLRTRQTFLEDDDPRTRLSHTASLSLSGSRSDKTEWHNELKDEGARIENRPQAHKFLESQLTRFRTTSFSHSKKCSQSNFTYNKDTDKCYAVYTERVSWSTARARCKAHGAILLTPTSDSSQTAISHYLAHRNADVRHCDFWLGLIRKPSAEYYQRFNVDKKKPMPKDAWVWISDGSPVSNTNWNEDEPNNADGNERCVQMLWIFDWKWNDASCDRVTSCYVCQTSPVD